MRRRYSGQIAFLICFLTFIYIHRLAAADSLSISEDQQIQLNAYAYIAEKKGYSPVKKIALAYMEPQTNLTYKEVEQVVQENGFVMPFWGKILQLDLKTDIIPGLFSKVRNLYEKSSPPQSKEECKDCRLLENLIEIIT